MELAPETNGALVRLVGRSRIRDGALLRVVLAAKATLCPWLVYDLIQARRARESWSEALFQLYSIGSVPASLSLSERALRVVCISDTHLCHEKLPPLPGGDVLVHCGDFTNHGSLGEVREFADWLASQPHPRKIVVPGNHDMILDKDYYDLYWSDWSKEKESHEEAMAAFSKNNIEVLVDRAVTVGGTGSHTGFSVFGSPWVTQGHSWKTAFNKSDSEMAAHWRTVPAYDVLLTHMPPRGVGDRLENGERVGCPFLADLVKTNKPKLHVFGHVHSDYGVFANQGRERAGTIHVNAASVSDTYFVSCLWGGREAIVVDLLAG
mmetsp:Transcript_2250/g.5300  ORF Transcript_2250/g.5300 Transcript_2250/m.5300 type:complete len:321 (+) Transcript_2250:28-990(+)